MSKNTAQQLFSTLISKTNEFIRKTNSNLNSRDDKVVLAQVRKVTQQPELIVNCSMRDYQIEGLNWMVRLFDNGLSGILADEMGLGKTLQTISLLAYLKETNQSVGPHIILVPLTTLGNWCNEFARFCPSINICRFHGTREEREEMLETIIFPGKFDVLITTYEMLIMEKATLRRVKWQYMIVDEAHRQKNENSRLAKHAREFSTKNRLLVTGTPLQNSLHELWAQLNFLLPSIFNSADSFDAMFSHVEETAGVAEDARDAKRGSSSGNRRSKHIVETDEEPLEEVDDDDIDMDQAVKAEMLHKLHDVLRPFMLRRLKNDVSTDLPPKKEILVYIGMTKMQKELYKGILLGNIDAVTGNSSQTKKLLNVVMQLRKAVNHPYLFPGVENEALDPLGEHLVQSSGKMIILDKLQVKQKNQQSRVLIFSQMTNQQDILQDFCTMRGYPCCRIDGNTSTEDRENQMKVFNAPESEKFIFLLSTRAGGLGINLYTADIVVIYDSDWNPQADLQAMDRAHRLGQKKPVFVYRFVTQHSIEERITMRAESKLKLDALVIQQGRLAQANQKLGNNEMTNMIRCGAENIFNVVESDDLDADIDQVLQKGLEKTEELNAKLSKFKGFDISLSESHDQLQEEVLEELDVEVQAKITEEAQALAAKQAEAQALIEKAELDERTERSLAMGGRNRHQPKPMKLPRLADFQLYDVARITALFNKEAAFYNRWVGSSEAAPAQSGLSEEEQTERLALLAAGFPSWTQAEFKTFLKASEKYGRNNHVRIKEDLPHKTVAEVGVYAEAFWLRHHLIKDADRNIKSILAGDQKLQQLEPFKAALPFITERQDDLNLAFNHSTYVMKTAMRGRGFTHDDDVALCFYANKHNTLSDGKRIRHELWADQNTQMFNYWMLSRTGNEQCRRTEMVARAAYDDLVRKRRKQE